MMPGGGKAPPWYLAGGAPTPIVAFQPKGAASQALSYVNLANPGTYNAFAYDANYPGHDAVNGWIFTGTQYLHTAATNGLKPVTFISRINSTASAAYYGIIGSVTGNANGYELVIEQTTRKTGLYKGDWPLIGRSNSASNNDRVIAVTYAANGDYACYLNGAPDGSGNNDQTITTTNLAIGAGYWYYSENLFVGNIYALAMYNSVLTPAQISAISTSMANLP